MKLFLFIALLIIAVFIVGNYQNLQGVPYFAGDVVLNDTDVFAPTEAGDVNHDSWSGVYKGAISCIKLRV